LFYPKADQSDDESAYDFYSCNNESDKETEIESDKEIDNESNKETDKEESTVEDEGTTRIWRLTRNPTSSR
jgi:hypothetical protein